MTTENLPIGWQAQAACKGLNTRVFFVNTRRQPTLGGLVVRLCHECPVQLQCYCYALLRGEQGIWGGSTDEERARLRPFVDDQTLSLWRSIVEGP
jgi:Transcription factor WhiB